MYRILIADDEGIMLESLKNIISSNYGNECEIHTAKTGRVVVEEAEKYPPDICFMDIQMPKMDGYTATREIRTLKDMKKANVPIIAMTANAFDEDRKKAIKAGMNGHIAKPIDVNVILQNLDRIFGNNGDEGTRAKE